MILHTSVVSFDSFDVQHYHEVAFIFGDSIEFYFEKITGRSGHSVFIRKIWGILHYQNSGQFFQLFVTVKVQFYISVKLIRFIMILGKKISYIFTTVHTQKNVWLNQPNFGWFNHRIWLLYGQQNFWLSEQNSLINKIWLIIPLFWLIQPNTMVNLKRRFCSSK